LQVGITVFGEAFGGILERATASVPTRQALHSGSDAAQWHGKCAYEVDRDNVGPTLVRLGYVDEPRADIRGDLPIESGLASSTVLAVLHLDRWSGDDVLDAISRIDQGSNGFPASGADSAAVLAQASGVYGLDGWRPLEFALPPGTHLLVPPKECLSDKLAPTLAMRAQRPALEPLIHALVATLESGGGLDLDCLADYSRILNSIGVYSRAQSDVIGSLLSRGVVAKGVGRDVRPSDPSSG
jgi:hypothetical protein